MPVAPASSLGELATECDEIVCLASSDPFRSVGAHYADFNQTSDEEVNRLLALARGRQPAHAAG